MTVFDPLRRKEVELTPEEEVRQEIINALHSKMKIPFSLMASEYAFKYNGLLYRSDIVVFDRILKPLMLVECKAPSVKLKEKVIDQVIRYNFVLNVKYIMISNGKTTYLCRKGEKSGKYGPVDTIPSYEEMINK